MVKKETILKLFVSSPNDLKVEREIVKQVIEDVNLIWPKYHDIRIELIMWETHSYPDIGVDPQDVINKQIPDYDIFVGMLFKRFGTPTGRAESGTEEEFNDAYSKYKEDPHLIKILFYFKKFEDECKLFDDEQVRLIHEFKKRISEEGVYYWQFSDVYNGLGKSDRKI